MACASAGIASRWSPTPLVSSGNAPKRGEVIPLAPHAEVDFSAGFRMSRILKSLRPDIVHAYDQHGVALAALALSMGPPDPPPALVATRRVPFRLSGNSFSRWKHRQVRRFIAASEAIRRTLVEDGVEPERTVTVHEGIDVERVTHVPAVDVHSEFWLPAGAPVVGNVGALVSRKGHRYLVDAASRVVREVPDARFVILGEGELRRELEQQIRSLHLERHVLLPGFRTDVLSILKSFDLFVMSSVNEGLGASLLDAMAARRAIIATTTGGVPEVVADGETGLLVAPRSGPALADAIVRLLRAPTTRGAMGDAGFARVSERFSADRMVLETLDVYRRALEEARRAAPA